MPPLGTIPTAHATLNFIYLFYFIVAVILFMLLLINIIYCQKDENNVTQHARCIKFLTKLFFTASHDHTNYPSPTFNSHTHRPKTDPLPRHGARISTLSISASLSGYADRCVVDQKKRVALLRPPPSAAAE